MEKRRIPVPKTTFTAVISVLLLILLPPSTENVLAADGSGFQPPGRVGDKPPELLEKKRPLPENPLLLPPLPERPETTGKLLQGVFIKQIKVTGSSIFLPTDFNQITGDYENRVLTVEDLESLRRDLTLFYVNRGYINSGAILPDQQVTEGLLELQIIEGQLADIEISGEHGFKDSFLRKRIELGAQTPLNVRPLQERLQLLQLDHRIQQVRAELNPGVGLGTGQLKVEVQQHPPISISYAFNNYQSPSIGAERSVLTVAHQNLTGRGDVASFAYGFSEGLDTLIDTWYSLPLNRYDTSVLLRYRKNDFIVVDRVFRPLDIVSESETFEFGLCQPIYRSLAQEFSLSLSIEREENYTTLGGVPFSFSSGATDGKTVVAPLRFAQDWSYRTQQQVFSARSRFSFGLDAFGATTHGDKNTPDGKFVSWLGQFQWARVLDFHQTQLLARLDLQRSNDPLLPVEQIPVGGRYSVRGYRENQLVRDDAMIASFESRIPLVQNKTWADYLQLCPFVDYGRGTTQGSDYLGPKDIASTGVGLRWSVTPVKSGLTLRADSEIYWGYQLRDISMPDDDLQDDGIHFQFVLTGFF